PSELIGAFLYAQMENASTIISARRRIFERYYNLLRPLEDEGVLRLPFVESECAGNGHMFYIVMRSLDERTSLLEHLKKEGILAVFHYVPLHSSPAGRKYCRASGSMEVTDDLSGRVLRLPMYYEMGEDDIHRVVESIKRYFRIMREKSHVL
ncbi:MAG TPA: DegT/DnrJ/EryC1/StrS family aminotransferase, partial [Deltaproteobacteria bacterium]|nr:DegT/DnrJ/EryC1/StrS family aminotransferase [Deltaproteobacteria bacterium]